MEVTDPRLSLPALDLKGDSAFAKPRKRMITGSENVGYQSFENADLENENLQGTFDSGTHIPNTLSNGGLNPEINGGPRVRRTAFFGGKDPPDVHFSHNRSGRSGNDDEVEECQIRTYGGSLTKQDFKKEVRDLCSWKTLRKRVPISLWLPHYTLTDLSGDVVAGLTVGLTVVPQALAYAQIADLPLEYGLYSAFMAPFIYAIFGTSKDITVGPSALLALLTGAFVPRRAVESVAAYTVILTFFCGCFQLLMGFLHLGFLMNFVSTPVMSGFTTAASIIIILGQLKGLLGISFGRTRDSVIYIIRGYVRHIWDTNGWDVLLGACCICAILLLKSLAPVLRWDRFRSKQSSFGWKFLREVIKVFCYGRYALVVIIAMGVAAGVTMANPGAITITNDVRGGFPRFAAPDFIPDNKTFVEVVEGLGSGLVLVPIIALFESIVVAKAFSHKFGYTVDSTQEFFALGLCNLMGSFVSAFPVTGAFSRTALNAESGVRTPLGGIFTGAFVLLAMSILSPILHYIPKAALSAVIICAIFVMIDFRIFRDLWHVNRLELIPLCSTLILCLLLGVQYGLPLGIGVSILMLVYPLARPLITVEYRRTYRREKDPQNQHKTKPKFNVSVTPHSALYFPSAEFFKDIFAKDLLNPDAFRFGVSVAPDFLYAGAAALDGPDEARSIGPEEKLPPIVFNGIHLLTTDYSTVRTLRNIVASCRRAKRDIVFINTSNEFMRLFQRVDEEVQMEQISTTADRTGLTLAHPDGSDRISIASEGLAISDSIQPALSYSSVDFPGTGTLPEDFVAKT